MAEEKCFIGKSMTLHRASSNETGTKTDKPRLLLMLAWLTSTDRYLDKYRSLYLSRGFDVLTVRTRVPEIMFPSEGSQVVAKNLMLYLTTNSNKYSSIVVHGFSVGAYQFSEFLVLMEACLDTPERVVCGKIKNKIRGVIFDSAVSARRAAHGVAVAAVGDNAISHIFEWLIVFFLKFMYPLTTKHHINAEETFTNTPLRCPAVLFCSHEDKIGDVGTNRRILNNWIQLGIHVVWKCWDSSPHVAHMQTYPQEYVDIISKFLDALNYD